MAPYHVSVLEALSEYASMSAGSAIAFGRAIFVFACIGYVATTCALYGSINDWKAEAWEPQVMLANLTATESFFTGSVDCILCSLICCVTLPPLAYMAVRAGAVLPLEDSEHSISSTVSSRSTVPDRSKAEPLQEPLLQSDGDTDPKSAKLSKEEYRERLQREQDLQVQRQLSARWHSTFFTGALFTVSTAAQIFIGVKCIGFKFQHELLHGTLMGLGVVWVNIMTWSLRQLINTYRQQDGVGCVRVLELHPHKLVLEHHVYNHSCDICGSRIKDGRAYRCKLCDFDLCVRCFTRKDSRTAEGMLRGDKGVRREEDLTTMAYFSRALALARREWLLFSAALLTLCANNVAQLWTPNLQGAILDRVAQGDRPRFLDLIQLYIAASVATGLFSGVQRLCFNLIGRRLANTVRNRLYRGMVAQDVAFFDGNASGQLTSRLSNDVAQMVSPIQTMLGTLLSSTLLLVGGVAMCFYTSWRLSMLAFTTVGPIVHITQVYAGWSAVLNRRILTALATANGIATEALGNIRTVKAMSTEDMEAEKFRQAAHFALTEGTKEALGSAGSTAINNYLDLGAGVLILWYGGSLAIDQDGRMSAGKLITYQLYWNMINSAYKGLVDIITQFTRAAGAAQRVFSLMDSLPDIPTDVGVEARPDGLIGTLELVDVRFTYQMRPDEEVIKGVNLLIPGGSTCALVGRSGSGKSTLVNLMLRFYDPSSGLIRLDGLPLPDWNLRSVHRQMALVSQDTQLFAESILDNITYGLETSSWTMADVVEAAKNACAHDFISSFPDGYDTRVGERGVRISGGQKQRIAIARCFMRKAKILLLDEATSALDAESESFVQAALDRLMAAGRSTVVLVAHRLSTVIGADKIAVMEAGRLVEEGSHSALIDRGGVYCRLVQKQIARQAKVLDQEGPSPAAAAAAAPAAADGDSDVVDTILDQLAARPAQAPDPKDADVIDTLVEADLPRPLPPGLSGGPGGGGAGRRGGGGRWRGPAC